MNDGVRVGAIGRVEVICGPMFAGKTEELLRRVRRAVIAGRQVAVFGHALDTRQGADRLALHVGLSAPAVAMASFEDIERSVPDGTDIVAIDEGAVLRTGARAGCRTSRGSRPGRHRRGTRRHLRRPAVRTTAVAHGPRRAGRQAHRDLLAVWRGRGLQCPPQRDCARAPTTSSKRTSAVWKRISPLSSSFPGQLTRGNRGRSAGVERRASPRVDRPCPVAGRCLRWPGAESK